jgi:hypothetical protein
MSWQALNATIPSIFPLRRRWIAVVLAATFLLLRHPCAWAATGNIYYFSHLAFSGGFQSTLTYVNYSSQSVTCVTNFYSNSGSPLQIPFTQGTISQRTDTLLAGQSIHDQTIANLTATVTQGWAEASCTGPVEASLLYRYYTNGVATSEAGVNAETTPVTDFVTFAQTATGVAYANPSTTETATVMFTVFSAAGNSLASASVMLGPLAHGSGNLGPMLGLSTFTGMLEITSTVPIVGLSLNAEAFPVISSLPPGDLPGGFVGGGPATYYFSHLAFAGGFQTTLTLINYSDATVTCTTQFYSDFGAPLLMPFNQGNVSTRTDVLPANGSVHDQTTAILTAAVAEGWAETSCTGPVKASLLFRYYTNGIATSEAGVNAETAPTTEFVTFAQTATGVAYANPSATQPALITLTVFSAAGEQLGSTSVMLGPLAHGAQNLGPLLGLSSFTGMAVITSTVPIISLSLNAEAFPVISSLPPGDLPAGTSVAPMLPFPPAPASLTAISGNTQVFLNWSASPPSVSYNLLRSVSNGGPYVTIASGVTATTYVDANLTNGLTYYYVVEGVNRGGTSGGSNQAYATPQSTPVNPFPPQTLTAVSGDSTVSLSWNSSPEATGYTVLRSLGSGGPYDSIAASVTTTDFLDRTVSDGTTYYYVVQATAASGTSGFSNQAQSEQLLCLPGRRFRLQPRLSVWFLCQYPEQSSIDPSGCRVCRRSFGYDYRVLRLDRHHCTRYRSRNGPANLVRCTGRR